MEEVFRYSFSKLDSIGEAFSGTFSFKKEHNTVSSFSNAVSALTGTEKQNNRVKNKKFDFFHNELPLIYGFIQLMPDLKSFF